uniref:tRNA1(Val) (adenine(37)-N6)-methyltransferase n=1 Tax=Thaumasiovibrio occultus TaxID=1891184 RepID=UPI001864A3C6|nr:methyltransferase [Thaumasiovibrio occultus]
MVLSRLCSMSFQFKQFYVDHADCGMPVSTDGILLGAWAALDNATHVLDIGTGTGLLALMAAQRNPHAQISAVEIDDTAYLVASKNIAASPWSSRIHLYLTDVRQWPQQPRCFDHIICNPPYFTSGETANKANRAIARHVDTLSHTHLLEKIHALLASKGRASLILPTYEGEQLLTQLPQIGLDCTRLCQIKATDKKPFSRLLIELVNNESCVETEISQLIIQQQGHYSAEFTALTWPFYLKMQQPE